MLNDFEQDALKELFNIGIGVAAHSLSQMVHEEVMLSVPFLLSLNREEAIRQIRERTSDKPAAIRQHFEGEFSGTAFLIYPESSCLELVYVLLGKETPLPNLTELEQESLLEVGNIILNACLGSLANRMQLEFRFDMPEYIEGDSALFFVQASGSPPEDELADQVLFLVVDFVTGESTHRRHVIKGIIILVLDQNAIIHLKHVLNARFGHY